METKFLSDGRKVAVIGKLNNDETIVQEVFVTDAGDEIPSGERFVTKSLHDQPVKSYKEREQEKAEERLAAVKKQTKEASRKYHDAKFALDTIQAALKQSRVFAELVPDEELEVFTQFLTGTIEYLVFDDYTIEPPVRMLDIIGKHKDRYHYQDKTFDSIRLLSVMGDLKGGLKYMVGEYSCDSGNKRMVYPFTSKADALDHIASKAAERIEKGHLSIENYKACLDMGITFPKEVAEKFLSDKNAALDDSHERYWQKHEEAQASHKKQRRELEGLIMAAAS